MKYFYLAITSWLLVIIQSVLVFYFPWWAIPSLLLPSCFWAAIKLDPAESLFLGAFLGIFVVFYTPAFWWAPLLYVLFTYLAIFTNRRFSLLQNLSPAILIFAVLSGATYAVHFALFEWSFSVWLFLPWFLTVFLTVLTGQILKKYEKEYF